MVSMLRIRDYILNRPTIRLHPLRLIWTALLQLGVRVPERQSGVANLPCNRLRCAKIP
jgi:hypothetical protein